MRCDDYEILISAYADGELDGSQAAAVEAHIEECASCRQLFDETVSLQRDMVDALANCQNVPDIVSAVTARIELKSRFRFAWTWAAAAAAALVAIGGYAFLQSPAKRVDNAVVYPPPPTIEHNHRPPAMQKSEQSKTSVEERSPKPTLQPRPKTPVRKPAQPVHESVPKTEQVAAGKVETPIICADEAEVIVEYTEGTNAAGHIADLATTPAPKIPVAGPGQQVVAETETITENGMQTQRVCYRIVDSNSASTLGKPDKGE